MQRTVTLNPGQSEHVSFLIVPNAEGIYDVQLNGLSGQFEAIQPTGQIIIDQMFFGSRDRITGYNTCDTQCYIRIRNTGQTTVSGRLRVYDWQEWWGQPPGEDRRSTNAAFTLAPNQVYRLTCKWVHVNFDKTYVRAEVVVDEVVITETPRIYIVPGKHWSGAGAKGECIQKEYGLAVMWYAKGGGAQAWTEYHRRPPTGSADYVSPHLNFRTTDYDRGYWPTAFLVVPDDDFVGGRQYLGYIVSGTAGGVHEVYFNFVA